VEEAVRARYSAGATRREESLCCPVSYDPRLLDAIPQEVVERDYGCGDPTRQLLPGETVLDLGSGAGKACFLASQVVGPEGRVIGIDMNDEMLALARRAAPQVAERLGYANVTFRKGRIQDLALDVERLDAHLAEHPARSAADLARAEEHARALAATEPLVPDASVDVVVSNCVLNLVRPEDKHRLFAEIHRVLRPGGRAVVSDIVCDEDVPAHLAADPGLWSGCVAGAFREDLFSQAFEAAGLYGIRVVERQARPWRTVEGIEFRSLTVEAWKGEQGACLDQGHAVVYRGPFREVRDDDGHVYRRGARVAVCGKTWRMLTRAPYREHFERLPPRTPVPEEQAPPFPCTGGMLLRDPRVTKAGAAGAPDAPDAPGARDARDATDAPCCGPSPDGDEACC
jgi:ubiquinone/menaquinone biosynthesis C-methylase UbiE